MAKPKPTILSVDDDSDSSTTQSAGEDSDYESIEDSSASAQLASSLANLRSASISKPSSSGDAKNRNLLKSLVTAVPTARLALKETNNGLKKSSAKKKESKKKERSSKSIGKQAEKNSKTSYRVGAVVILPCGLAKVPVEPDSDDDESDTVEDDDEKEPKMVEVLPDNYTVYPDVVKILDYKGMGLAVTDYDKGFKFDRSMSFEELMSALRKLFPLFFDYLITLPDDFNFDPRTKDQFPHRSPLLLCTKQRTKVCALTQLPFPTGSDAHKITHGTSKASFQDITMVFVARLRIPKKELKDMRNMIVCGGPGGIRESEGKAVSKKRKQDDVEPPTPLFLTSDSELPPKSKRTKTKSPTPTGPSTRSKTAQQLTATLAQSLSPSFTIDLTSISDDTDNTTSSLATSSTSTLSTSGSTALARSKPASNSFTFDPTVENPWSEEPRSYKFD
ncbi:hypothetical protein H0H93_016421 [Arthromyces matolae]|nr:hypothetical protein H0H93_016421 [Arthromyces matolae]